jgi:hypothetical protein
MYIQTKKSLDTYFFGNYSELEEVSNLNKSKILFIGRREYYYSLLHEHEKMAQPTHISASLTLAYTYRHRFIAGWGATEV